MNAPPTVSEARRALHEAIVKAQGEFPVIPKDKIGDAGAYRYSYADLASILALVRPVLSKHGLALVQRLENPGGEPSLRTELIHIDGEAIAGSFPLGTIPANPQQLGSLLTYLRRYAIVAILGIAAEDDDDGKAAAPAQAESQFKAPEKIFEEGEGGAETLSDPQRKKIFALRTKLLNANAFSEDAWKERLGADYGTESVSELTKAQASALIERLVRAEKEAGL